MPAMYALGQHPALQEVASKLLPKEQLFAYLDDVYVVCLPERVTEIFHMVSEALKRHSGIEVNLGKTKVWNEALEKPPRVEELGAKAWL